MGCCRRPMAGAPDPHRQDQIPGETTWNQNSRPGDSVPAPKCGGTLAYGEDRYGPYLTCLHCGKLFDLLAAPHDAPVEDPDSPTSRVVRNRSRLTGPMTRERREMYREWCAIIRTEGLTVNQAAERFGVSYRTIYRILHEFEPETTQPGDLC